MDAPDHPHYRRLTTDWFKPSSLARLQGRLDELSADVVARMEAFGGQCDFGRDVAVWYPLQVILAILGLPEEDYPRMLKLTQELFGASDDDLGLGTQSADGLINGAPMPDIETVSYYVIVATAGHDTTSSAFAGGMQALAEHPDQFAKLKADVSLLPKAVDEMIRWVSRWRQDREG